MEKLSRILHDLDQGNINVETAKKQVLDLFAVSHLLLAFCEYAEPIYWGENEFTDYKDLIEPFIKSQ